MGRDEKRDTEPKKTHPEGHTDGGKGGAKGGSSAPPSVSLYINQYSDKTTNEDLKKIFASFGNVVKVDIKSDKNYAFVEFDKVI